MWQRDQEDKANKEETGKKAYLKWKKKYKLAIPQAGEVENQEQVGRARENWKSRRMARHGWKQESTRGDGRGRSSLKNNKTKAIEKRFKKRLINKSESSKGGKGKSRGRGRK